MDQVNAVVSAVIILVVVISTVMGSIYIAVQVTCRSVERVFVYISWVS